MRLQGFRSVISSPGLRTRRLAALSILLSLIAALFAGCDAVEQPKTTPFYAETAPPPVPEFRWSNGRLPKSLDPALAAAAPETDVVRALFEGLTEIEPKTLEARPAAAEKWSTDAASTTWTFTLRANAKWSNGKPVTARDFEWAWQRLAADVDTTAHPELLSNFKRQTAKESANVENRTAASPVKQSAEAVDEPAPETSPPAEGEPQPGVGADVPKEKDQAAVPRFAVRAQDDRTLLVTLEHPDPDLPKLVAHAIFRPVFDGKQPFDPTSAATGLVTNGAFRVTACGPQGVTLERSATYWNASGVRLERVRFVPAETAEVALDAYRRGELDAVTNFEFSPLVLKLLEPYSDFQRNTHGALNFYEVNYRKYPFDDRRVREALASAIEREKLTETELGGATRPAFQFLPFTDTTAEAIVQDAKHAAELLSDAGFPRGENFPAVRLVVNRNDVQLRIARSVARMWKQNLNIDTEMIVKETSEMEDVREAGDFDVIRRGVVMPTADEMASLNAILDGIGPSTGESQLSVAEAPPQQGREPGPKDPDGRQDDELFRVYAIPLYFPTSYSLVKPYVAGFEMGGLDAPILGDVRVDNQWQPKKAASESN